MTVEVLLRQLETALNSGLPGTTEVELAAGETKPLDRVVVISPNQRREWGLLLVGKTP